MNIKSILLLSRYRNAGVVLSLILLILTGCSSFGPVSTQNTVSQKLGTVRVKSQKTQATKTHYQKALAEIKSGNIDKAGVELKLALQKNPLDAKSHFLLGCLLEREGEYEQAIVAFQKSVAIDPTNSDALYNLGTMLLWRGEVVQASRMLENAVLIHPDHVPSHNNLGKAYFLTGLPELAIASYKEALRLAPSNIIALNNLLLLAEAAGKQDEANTYRRRLGALGNDPAAKINPDAEEPITQLPAWPLTTATDSLPSPLQASDAKKPKAPPDKKAEALRELLQDLPYVSVERRAGRLTLTGYTTGPKEREMLNRILTGSKDTLDLTSDDTGDPQRMIEFDAVLFLTQGLDQKKIGFNFLKLIEVNFDYLNSSNTTTGTGTYNNNGLAYEPDQWGWIFSASASYSVNIANASDERVAVLARPHLTSLSGTSASFLAGGEIVFRVSGNISGDIKPYPFGTKLKVSPTLLRTPAEDGTPRVHVKVEAERLSVLNILEQTEEIPVTFSKVTVDSVAVITMNQALILSGLSQREDQVRTSGVPILKSIPIIKYFFSTRSTISNDTAVVILLMPRDPAYENKQYRETLREFTNMRRDLIKAQAGTKEDMQHFRERYPNWNDHVPNRFMSHLTMLENSELYRKFSGQKLTGEGIFTDLLGSTSD